MSGQPLVERKARLNPILMGTPGTISYSDHIIGEGRFSQTACNARAEGIISKRMEAPYRPVDHGLWWKAKCLHLEEFVILGYTDPEDSRPCTGSLLVYAGRR